ncbi:hypothetical protein TcWFU_010107 [Taenia crassiceps]|uniref:Uncharacterized protein n=1 Tax=Taenia crassiceps TaxID=6207 RepID=A0ABR4Q2M4_9CEST
MAGFSHPAFGGIPKFVCDRRVSQCVVNHPSGHRPNSLLCHGAAFLRVHVGSGLDFTVSCDDTASCRKQITKTNKTRQPIELRQLNSANRRRSSIVFRSTWIFGSCGFSFESRHYCDDAALCGKHVGSGQCALSKGVWCAYLTLGGGCRLSDERVSKADAVYLSSTDTYRYINQEDREGAAYRPFRQINTSGVQTYNSLGSSSPTPDSTAVLLWDYALRVVNGTRNCSLTEAQPPPQRSSNAYKPPQWRSRGSSKEVAFLITQNPHHLRLCQFWSLCSRNTHRRFPPSCFTRRV